MTVHEAEFRLTVYDDEAMTTPLTPPSGAPHSDSFQVATTTGVSGFQPYLYYPRGRQASLNPRSVKADTAKLTARILDQRTTEGGSNLERWVTAFVGDEEGKPDLGGHMAQWEISTDGGSTWANYFTGRVTEPGLDGRPRMQLVVEGMNRELDAEIFVGEPHASVDYAFMAPVWPLGLTEEWAGAETKPRIPTTADIGGTLYANELIVDEAALEGEMASRNIVTKALKQEMLSAVSRLSILEINEPAPGLLVLADNLTTGDSGALYVTRGSFGAGLFGGSSGHIQTERTDEHHHRVTAVGVTELPASHPDHMPLPSDGDEVEIAIQADRPASEEAPLLIDDVHPARLMRDIADGYFSHLNDDGTPQWSVPRDTSSQGTLDDHVGFANLIADESFTDCRGVITEPQEAKQFLNESLGQAHRVGRRWNGGGELVPVDLRVPESASGLDTIGQTDLDVSGSAPSWKHSRKDAVTMVTVTHYVDEIKDTAAIREESAEYPAVRPVQVVSTEVETRVLDVGDSSLGVKEIEIDAILIRSRVGEGTKENQDAARRKLAVVKAVAEEYRTPYGRGPEYIEVPLRRTDTVEGIEAGDVVIIDVDAVPDPETAKRGGARVVRVAGRRDDGQNIRLDLVDQYAVETAAQPSVGNPSAATGADGRFQVTFDVTLNGSGDPARVEVAVTPQSTSSRPAEASSAWQFVEVVSGAASSTHTVEVEVPAGKRVWPRARSVPDGEAPSDWAYPSTESGDSDDLAAISGLGHSQITGSSALASWTVGDSDLDVVVKLRNTTTGTDVKTIALPPGTTEHEWRGLNNGDGYETTVWHRGPSGEPGPKTSAAFTAGADNEQAPTLRGFGILYGHNFQVGDSATGDRPTGVIVYIMPRDSSLPTEMEIAPDDGTGNPDTGASSSVQVGPGIEEHTFELPMDGTHRFIRGRHTEPGADPAEWTAWHECVPRKLPAITPEHPQEPAITVDVRIDGGGNVSIEFDGSPAVGSYRYEVQTGDYLDPDSSSTLVEADAEGDATVTDVLTVSSGERAYVSVDVYLSDDGTGTPIASARASEFHGRPGQLVSVDLKESDFDDDDIIEARAVFTIVGLGTYELVPEAMQGRGTTFEKPADVAWASATSSTGSLTGLTETDTVTVDAHTVEGLATFIRADLLDDETGEVLAEKGPYTYDPNSVPNFENVQIHILDGGQIDIQVLGDAVDTQSIEAVFDFEDDGTDDETLTAGSAGSPTNSLDQTTSGHVPQGEVGTVTITLYSNDDRTGQTASTTLRYTRQGVFAVEWTASEDRENHEATLTGDVVGPGTYTVRIKEVLDDGTTTTHVAQSGVTDGGTNDPVSYTATLSQKKNTKLFGEVVDDATGLLIQRTHLYSFDADAIPEFETVAVDIRDDGTVKVEVLGDAVDTSAIDAELDFAYDGTTFAADETLQAGSAGSPADDMDATSSGTVAKGDILAVRITLYQNADRTGTTTQKLITKGRGGADSAPAIQPNVQIERGDGSNLQSYDEETEQSFDITPVKGADVPNSDLRIKWKVDDSPVASETTFDHDGDGNDDWTSVTDGTVQPDMITVSRIDKPGVSQLTVVIKDFAPASQPEKERTFPVLNRNKSTKGTGLEIRTDDPGTGPSDQPENTLTVVI